MQRPISRPHPVLRPLPFQRLEVYRFALELVRLGGTVPQVRGGAELRDQLRRASASVALNVAEGSGKTGADRKRYFLIARGSVCESAAALDVLQALGMIRSELHADGHALCDRIYAMLTGLLR